MGSLEEHRWARNMIVVFSAIRRRLSIFVVDDVVVDVVDVLVEHRQARDGSWSRQRRGRHHRCRHCHRHPPLLHVIGPRFIINYHLRAIMPTRAMPTRASSGRGRSTTARGPGRPTAARGQGRVTTARGQGRAGAGRGPPGRAGAGRPPPGRATAGRGRVRAAGGRVRAAAVRGPYIPLGHIRSGLPAIIDKYIPDSMKACITGWNELNLVDEKFDIMTREEYENEYTRSPLEESYVHVAKAMETSLANAGCAVNAANALDFLVSEEVFVTIAKYASQVLVSRGLPIVKSYELRMFFATKLLRSRFDMSSDKSWDECLKPLATKHGFTLMEKDRFNNILTSIRGYDVVSRAGDGGDSSWMQRKNLLRNLNELEKAIFKHSAALLFNTKNGTLVIDDELVASRAGDVEAKAYTMRKAGKDGPIADAMADSMICLLLGMRLRVTGESQRDNVTELLKTAPVVTDQTHHPRFTTDRGYTSEVMVADTSLEPFDVTAICNSAARNPFFSIDTFNEWIERCRERTHFQRFAQGDVDKKRPLKDPETKKKLLDTRKLSQCTQVFEDKKWAIDKDEMMGSDVRVATMVRM